MFKSILVAMDESKNSECALKTAAEIAQLSKAKLKGLYVEDSARLMNWQAYSLAGASIGMTTGIPDPLPTEEQLEIEKEFYAEKTKIKKLFTNTCKNSEIDDFPCNSIFYSLRGQVDKIIKEEAKKVDLIVIGKRGRTFPQDSPEPGPIVDNLLKNSIRPVIIVPPQSKRTTRILMAYDGSEASARALTFGAHFAMLQKTKLFVITISKDKEHIEKIHNEAKEFLDPYRIETKFIDIASKNHEGKEILSQADELDIGLIVMGAYGDNKIKEFIFGSTTREVIMHSKCPIFLCR